MEDRRDSLTGHGTYDDAPYRGDSSWQERYDLVNSQLMLFKKQAGKIRELLTVKMKEYEDRVMLSEKERDSAYERIQRLELSCQDKDEAISALREKILRIRDERNTVLAMDDEKMDRIKDWVKSKVTELLKELDVVRKERDELKMMVSLQDIGYKEAIRSSDRSLSKSSANDQSSDYYEEIFGSLLDDIQKRKSETNYETVKSMVLSSSSDGCKYQSNRHVKEGPPEVPPRRESVNPRRCIAPNTQIPFRPQKSPQVTRKLFNLSESRNEFGSLQTLNEEIGKLALDDEDSKKQNSVEPESHLYYTLQEAQETVVGMEFEGTSKAPVYSTLRGKASKIRNVPFTGESTDSDQEADSLYRDEQKVTFKSRKQQISFNVRSAAWPSSPHLKTCAPYTAQNMRKETLEKAGFLTKLGGRVKNWKKRWFVLSQGKLSYYKSRSDMYRKPLGQIDLEVVSQISKSERPLTFEIASPTRLYHLTGSSPEDVHDWMRVLRNSMRRFSSAPVLSKSAEKVVYSGWLTTVKGGVSSYGWAVLKPKFLHFYKSDGDQIPVAAIDLRHIVSVLPVREDNLDEEAENFEDHVSNRLVIQCIKDSHPLYFVVADRSQMEIWLHNLQKLCSGGDSSCETDFERTVNKLMNIDGDQGSRYWQSSIMIHSREVIKESLTNLPSTDLEDKAISIFKNIQLFSTTPINELAVDYHIRLAQDTISMCLRHPELQTEIYCQLIKQTSKYRSNIISADKGSSALNRTSDWLRRAPSEETIDLNPVPGFVFVQGWQLLALCLSIFVPKLRILWLLRAHLQRNASENTDTGRYAIFCQRSLDRILNTGEREMWPSRIEALSLILRNPYYRLLPLSVPVYFINNAYQVFSFDGSTSVSEFCGRINEETGIRPISESGYALFTDNPIAQIEHCLQGDLKLCDAISKWEQAAMSFKTGRFERSRVIRLTYKNRIFFKSQESLMSEKEKFFQVYETARAMKIGHLRAADELTSRLVALISQIEYGDYVDHFDLMEDSLQKLFPGVSDLTDAATKRVAKLTADAWADLKGRSVRDCVDAYLSLAEKIPFYGCKLFKAQEKLPLASEERIDCWIVVEEDGIRILDSNFMQRDSYMYPNVVTFGGYKEDFMMVVQLPGGDSDRTTRHLLSMSSGKVLELTLLIASYINAVVTRAGLSLEARGGRSSMTDATSKDDLHLWDMESSG